MVVGVVVPEFGTSFMAPACRLAWAVLLKRQMGLRKTFLVVTVFCTSAMRACTFLAVQQWEINSRCYYVNRSKENSAEPILHSSVTSGPKRKPN